MTDVITTFKTNPEQLTTSEKSGSGMFSDFLAKCAQTATDLQLVGG